MRVERITLENQTATKKLGRTLAQKYENTPAIIFLSGELGAGKTTFAQGFIQALALVNHVSSPTYAYVNQYVASLPLYHFDLYRIDVPDTIVELGLDSFLTDDSAIRLIEWPERLPAGIITPTVEIHLEKVNDSRHATLVYH